MGYTTLNPPPILTYPCLFDNIVQHLGGVLAIQQLAPQSQCLSVRIQTLALFAVRFYNFLSTAVAAIIRTAFVIGAVVTGAISLIFGLFACFVARVFALTLLAVTFLHDAAAVTFIP